MRTPEQLVDEVREQLESKSELLRFASEKSWIMGRVLFEEFGKNPKASCGLTTMDLAALLGLKSDVSISRPLRVYRYLGAWYERQEIKQPFEAALLAVRHDPERAEKLMELFLQRGWTVGEFAKWLNGEMANDNGPDEDVVSPMLRCATKFVRRAMRSQLTRELALQIPLNQLGIKDVQQMKDRLDFWITLKARLRNKGQYREKFAKQKATIDSTSDVAAATPE